MYLDKFSNLSVIFELFALDTHVSKEQIFLHYYNDMALCNSAIESQIVKLETLHNPLILPRVNSMDSLKQFEMYGGVGIQRIPKGKSNISRKPETGPSIQNDEVLILLFLIRIPVVQTDISISMNIPYSSGVSSLVHADYVSWLLALIRRQSISELLLESPSPEFEKPLQVSTSAEDCVFPSYDPLLAFQRALASFTIKNWSLFA